MMSTEREKMIAEIADRLARSPWSLVMRHASYTNHERDANAMVLRNVLRAPLTFDENEATVLGLVALDQSQDGTTVERVNASIYGARLEPGQRIALRKLGRDVDGEWIVERAEPDGPVCVRVTLIRETS